MKINFFLNCAFNRVRLRVFLGRLYGVVFFKVCVIFKMDIETKWAKSTESRIEMFLDDYLIGSSVDQVRCTSQKLLLSLFRKGNNAQQKRILDLIQDRCKQLPAMGRASQDFLSLTKSILSSTS